MYKLKNIGLAAAVMMVLRSFRVATTTQPAWIRHTIPTCSPLRY